MTTFTVELLPRDQIRAAYPLIREAIPGLSFAAWQRFARDAMVARRKGQSGIIVARREGCGLPCGLFCFRIEPDPELGKVLVAEHFVAVDLLYPADVLAALLEALDDLGRHLGCKAVRGVVDGAEVWDGLAQAGHSMVGSVMGKRLAERDVPSVTRFG